MTARPPSTVPPRQQVPVWFLFAVMALMAVTAASFLYLGTRIAPGGNLPVEELKILGRAYDRIDRHYIYDLSPEKRADLMHAAVSGMVRELDDYCRDYPPAKSEDYNRNTRGVMTGIGVVVQSVDDRVVLLYPMPNGPAEHAGLRVGDVVTAIDGTTVTASGEAVKIIKGELDTDVRLRIQRDSAEPFEVTVTRKAVTIPSLKWARVLDREKRIGYVYLKGFAEKSATELDLALGHLELQIRERLAGLVLDMRHNPGGLLDTCLEITNRFLREGKLVTLKRRNTEDIVHTADPDKCTRPDIALVLILDKNAASASEVLAGALRDHGRARIVGTESYGKGVVQSVFSWVDRKEKVKITTSYYLTPKGHNIERRLRPEGEQGEGGIEPDVVAKFKNSSQRKLAVSRLRRREVPRKYRAAVDELAASHEAITIYRPLPPQKDVQLGAALEEVRRLLAGRETGK